MFTQSFARRFPSGRLVVRRADWLKIYRRLLILGLLLAGIVCPVGAVVPVLPDYFSRGWKTDDGLPDNAVTAILQTHDGYLWFATYGGLARFDGVRFTVFNSANTPELQSDRVTSLFEDREGALWIGHERGDLTCYRNGKFVAQEGHETGGRRKVSAIGQDDSGDIWMLNEEGTLIRVRDGMTCSLANNDGVVMMAQNDEGKLWVASDGRLGRVEHGLLMFPTVTNSSGVDAPLAYVQGICAGRDGGVWVISDGRVRELKEGNWIEDRGTNPCNTTVSAMIETSAGVLAMGTVDSGLYLLFPDHSVLHFNQGHGLPHDWVRCLTEDSEGTLWLGVGSGGVVALRPGKVKTLISPDDFQGRVALTTTVTTDGAVWVGTEGAGLYRLHDQQWEHFGESSGLSNLFVWCASADAQGRLWAGTWGGGMFMLEGDRFIAPPGLENVKVPMAAILQTPPDVTWIGTASGLLRYQNGTVKRFGEPDGLIVPDVRTIVAAPDGTIWFGMLGGGLGRLQAGHVRQLLKNDGLASDYVQCLNLETNGTLWIGTYGSGLARLQDGHFSKISTADGLPDNFISAIESDEHGNFWVSSHNGIFRVALKDLNAVADGRMTNNLPSLNYGKGEGMPSLICSGGLQPAATRLPDGRVAFTTSKGLVCLNPEAARINRRQPPVVIEEITASGHLLAAYPHNRATLSIAPGTQRFEFHYTGLSFVAPEKIQFQYRLEGWEKDWVDAGIKRLAEYSYLPPGEYNFQVRACNSDGIWNENGASFAFVVQPYFWQTVWFHGLAGLAGSALIAGLVLFFARRRMRRKLDVLHRQQAIERERTRIAKDIHDHLGANLTRISLLSQSAHGELTNTAQAATQLDRIYETSRELTRSMDEIVWAVNPQHDELDSLASYLGNFAQEYLVSLNIRCRLEMPLHLPHWPINAELRHNVFLAFKEALHNIVKHAGATEVNISLATEAGGFRLIIRDNGRGFQPTDAAPPPGRGNGLKNLRQRLDKIGGHCEIESVPGSGTEVRFFVAVPLPVGHEAKRFEV